MASLHLAASALLMGAGMDQAQAQACTSTITLYASTSGTASGTGADWANALSLQAAIGKANGDSTLSNCYDIRIQQGVYKPTTSTTDRGATFAINRPMRLLGGHTGPGTGDARVVQAANTVLSGDIDNNDVKTGGITLTAADQQGGNSYNVVVIGGTGNSGNGQYGNTPGDRSYTLLEGLTITGGKADGAFLHRAGGGLFCNGNSSSATCSPSITAATLSGNSAELGGAMLNYGYHQGNSSPSITNATFSGNSAYGGAMVNYGYQGNSSPSIINATFSGNSATYGGAMFNEGFSGNSSPSITNATFSGNSASQGGAMYNSGSSGTSSPSITNATFSGNSATYGGAMFNEGFSGNSSPSITNATFSGNSASGSGGAMYNDGRYSGTSSPSITNATFSGNKANDFGGAVFNDGDNGTSKPSITASIFWGDTVNSGNGPEIWNSTNATSTVTHSIVQIKGSSWTNTASNDSTNWFGDANDATVNNPNLGTLANNGGATQTLLPGAGSAALDKIACPAGVSTDQRGVARPQGAQCDIGAVEARQYALAVTVAGAGGVQLDASAIGGITPPMCPTDDCSGLTYVEGQLVTLSANTNAGFTFAGWSGACTGTNTTCTVTLDSAKSVTAQFTALQSSFSGTTVPSAGTAAGTATASITGGGASCQFDSANTHFVAAPSTLPAGQTMPHGMLAFQLIGCDQSPVTVSITWPAAVQGMTKWGKATANASSSYFAPTGASVNGNTTQFTVQDGQLGDDDWAVNGVIVDPVGATVPVATVTPVPTLGVWAMLALSSLLGLLGLGEMGMKRRKLELS